mgnify:CR=1 FL=1
MNFLDLEIPSEPSPPPRIWSPYQCSIFDFVADSPQSNLIIQAVAGSGKTTTIVEATQKAPGSSLFLAFNKAIAEDIRSRTLCDVKTLNALGHRLWAENLPRATLDGKKLDSILNRAGESELIKEFRYDIKRAVGLAKNNAFGLRAPPGGIRLQAPTIHYSSPELIEFKELIDSYLDVPAEMIEGVAVASLSLFEQSIEELDTFDFDDQLYVPLMKGWGYPRYDNLFVDEFQDLSPIQHLMLEVMTGEGSRLVGVGDRNQAIYGFRGAMHDSMDAAKIRFAMTELPLSISYRCAKRVVAEAQLYSEHILAAESAPEGTVSYCDDERGDPELFDSAMILCRNNAPLFRAILKHVRARKPCRVLSNFLDSFTSWLRKFKAEDSRNLQRLIDQWYAKERLAAEKKEFRGKLAALEDKYDTASLFCREYATKSEILRVIGQLAQGSTGPTFATIHKAKGLEHENVYLLRPDLMPAFYARSPEQLQQENNLTYGAITRAKHSLTWGERLRR